MLTRLILWLHTGDNAFGVVCVACGGPLFALCLIGMIGSGAP